MKIKEFITVDKERKLPIQGEVLVEEGQEVSFDTVVAETAISGDPVMVPASVTLGVEPEELEECMVKKIGDSVEKDEVLAKYSLFFGLIKRTLTSPLNGTVEAVSNITGQIIVRGAPIPVHVDAYIPGKVVKVLPREGAIIETTGAFIQGIFGIGGERHGRIRVVVASPDEVLKPDEIGPDDKGNILVGGSLITLDAIRKAVELGVAGIIGGGIESGDLTELMGVDIGVAITGEEELGITVIITEGFGQMTMHKKTFDIFKQLDGLMASINGATQIRAGVIRPEVVIPYKAKGKGGSKEELSGGMVPGTPVRIIRNPYFGAIGKVAALPVELQVVETESKVRVLEVELEDGRKVVVPRANVEIIEE